MKAFLIPILLQLPFLAFAQDNYAYLSWDFNVPLSNKEWLESSSPHGGALGFRYFLRDKPVSIGVDLSWTTFEQYEPTQTFQQSNGAITTDYYKYIYQYGGVLGGQYYFKTGEDKILFPYAGLGAGASYNQFTRYYNIYEDTQKSWAFLVRPEAGVLIKFGKYRSLGAIMAVHYDFTTAKSEEYNYSGFSSAGVKLGVMMMGRN